MKSDKKQHRFVTFVSLLFVLVLYLLMRSGVLGDTLARFATICLIIQLVVLGGRAVLTELGIRRKRVTPERRL